MSHFPLIFSSRVDVPNSFRAQGESRLYSTNNESHIGSAHHNARSEYASSTVYLDSTAKKDNESRRRQPISSPRVDRLCRYCGT